MVKDKKEKIDLLSSSHSSSTSSSYGCEIGDPSSSSSSLSSLPYSDVDDIVEKLNDDAQCRLRFVDAGEVDSLGTYV